jgi:hypothetical protein
VGSAPNIRRTSGNGPSLALQSRLQRQRDCSLLASSGSTEVVPKSARCLPRASRAPFRVLHEQPTSNAASLTTVWPKPSRRSLSAADSTRTSISVLLGASHPNPALRPEGQGVESGRPGFLTRSAPFLPRRVEVLFQTGNTLGVAPPSPAGHSPPERVQASCAPGQIRRPFPAVARCRLPTRLSPRGLPRLPAGRVGVATTFFYPVLNER